MSCECRLRQMAVDTAAAADMEDMVARCFKLKQGLKILSLDCCAYNAMSCVWQ
jgi:hypothetical protein